MHTVTVVAHAATLDHLVELWHEEFGDDDRLFWTSRRIKMEMAIIRRRPALAHLRWINTLEDWASAYPGWAVGRGELVVPDCAANLSPRKLGALRRKVDFLLDHLELIKEIHSLEGAAELLGMKVPFDTFIDGEPTCPQATGFEGKTVAFNDPVYQQCLQYRWAALWELISAFRSQQTRQNWEALKFVPIPWLGHETLAHLEPSPFETLYLSSGDVVPALERVEDALRSCLQAHAA